ncbi:MAG TPA: hypothetical protein V6C57_21480, partial [Coleofasciculaceae cyanobacterium]
MDPLLGFLGASVVVALVGTTLKGIIRPLSWAVLAGAALLFGSSKVVDATNSLAQSPNVSPPNVSPSPTTPLTSNATTGVPPAAQGWQAAASGLDPALSSLYGPGQMGQGQIGQGQAGQEQIGQGQTGQAQVEQPTQPAQPETVAPAAPASPSPPPRV